MENVKNETTQLKSELEKFKEEQRKLLEKLQEQQGTIEPQLQPLQQETPAAVDQVSPSTFTLEGENLLDIEKNIEPNENNGDKETEEKAKQEIEKIKPTETFTQQKTEIDSNGILNTLNPSASSKAQLALLTLEEEILTDSIEIYLPGLKENVVVKPLNNIEELNLKTQNLSFATFLNQLNILLLNKTHIQNIPLKNYFKTIEDFEAKILPIDRVLMIFSLIKNSFENLTEFTIVCENCEKEFIATPSIENLNFKFEIDGNTILKTDFYTFSITKSYLNGKLEIDFGFNPEIVRLQLLKLKSNEEVKQNVEEKNKILDNVDDLILFIKKIRVYKPDKRTKKGKKLITEIDYYQDGFQEIFDFVHNMPMKVKDLILNKTDLSELEKYSPIFKITEACPFCGHIHELDISPEIEFFRKTLSLLSRYN